MRIHSYIFATIVVCASCAQQPPNETALFPNSADITQLRLLVVSDHRNWHQLPLSEHAELRKLIHLQRPWRPENESGACILPPEPFFFVEIRTREGSACRIGVCRQTALVHINSGGPGMHPSQVANSGIFYIETQEHARLVERLTKLAAE